MSRFPRPFPVEPEMVALYAGYQLGHDAVVVAAACDMVIVNLFHTPLGRPMRYGTAKELFDLRFSQRPGSQTVRRNAAESLMTSAPRGGQLVCTAD
ncbi:MULTISPECIES: hypothetical protein [unclassified Streptomyces]|uniref:hypothetical protein n=2 Tax=unclassified Streptomyces TaxID=2593676 RepID=UPI0033D90EE3